MIDMVTFSGNANASAAAGYMQLGVLLLVFVAMYFILIRPQKKQEKKDAAMRDNIQIGDEIITNGGIVGMVVSVKDDTILLETGGSKNKIRVMKWAVAKNNTIHDD